MDDSSFLQALHFLSRLNSSPDAPRSIAHEFDKASVLRGFAQGYRHFEKMETQFAQGSLHCFKPSFIQPSLPSVPLNGLLPIALAQMEVDKTHRGRVLFGILCVDAFKVTGIMTCVEDEAGHVVRLSIYNAAPSSSSFAAVQKLFPKGTKVAVKEPYLKRASDGLLALRVDNPANVEKLEQPSTHCESNTSADPDQLRSKGNGRFAEKDWEGAIKCYTSCIAVGESRNGSSSGENSNRNGAAQNATSQTILLAYSNRAEAWMKLENYEQALADCEKALAMDADHVKSMFRKGRALHGLLQYQQASACFESVLRRHPELQEVQSALDRSRRCFSESEQGEEQLAALSDFLLAGRKTADAPKCRDYIGPVLIKKTQDGRGRGLFVSQDVKAGDLLLVSNAMAFCHEDSKTVGLHIDLSSRNANLGSQEDLVTKVVSLAMASPKALQQLYCLAASHSQKNIMVPSMDLFKSTGVLTGREGLEGAQIDMKRIREIVRLNSFGSAPSTFLLEGKLLAERLLAANQYSALWLLPSFINHSCVPNASRLDVGEAMFVHAASDIQAGHEVCISYFDALVPLKLREEACQRWGFRCNCKRCGLERSLKEPLQGISRQFDHLYVKAAEEVHSALSAGESLPLCLPACTELSKLFNKLKKKTSSLMSLTSLQQKWILAGYSSSFLGKWLVSGFAKDSALASSTAVELVEAMRSAVPGHIRTLSFVARLVKIAQMGVGEQEFANRLMQQGMDECICVFGKLKPHALEQLIEQYSTVIAFL